MRPDGLTILSGGTPSAEALAALAGAVTALVDGERVAPADPRPAAYRSRWRRAALIESAEVPAYLKDDRTAWEVH